MVVVAEAFDHTRMSPKLAINVCHGKGVNFDGFFRKRWLPKVEQKLQEMSTVMVWPHMWLMELPLAKAGRKVTKVSNGFGFSQ